jgi:hypothetical protein
MIRFLRDMAKVGQLLLESNRVPDPITSRITSYYLCEVTDLDLRLTYQTDPLVVPKRQAKGSSLACDFLDETLKFFKGTRDLKGTDPFWVQCFTSLEEAGEGDILAAVREFKSRLDEYDAVLGFTSTTNERFYYLVRRGSPRPEPVTEKVTRRNMGSIGVHSDAVTIVMTYQGAPITGTPKVLAWWRARCSAASTTPQDLDLVKGEYCHPSRLIERIRVIDAPLVSFNKDSPTFEFEGLSQAFNFPVAQETQTQFNVGFGWVVRKEGGQSVLLSKVGPSTIEIGWWPAECVDHPILEPLVAILHGAKKKLVEDAWVALQALTVDNTDIHFAAWSRSKSRFALVDQWVVPADELREALLRFHSEFWQAGYDPVRWTITHENGKAPPTLHPSCFLPTFKAVVTGLDYPDSIATYYYNNSHKWSTEQSSLWIKAYLTRKLSTMAKPYFRLNLDPIRKQYPRNAPTPVLEDYLSEARASLEPFQLAAFNYGVMLSMAAKIKKLYHWGHFKKDIDTWDYPNNFRYPRRFFDSEVRRLAAYRAWLDKRRSALYLLTSHYLSEYMPKIDLVNMDRSIAGMPVYVNIGWEQGIAYFQELTNYSRQMQSHFENTPSSDVPDAAQ